MRLRSCLALGLMMTSLSPLAHEPANKAELTIATFNVSMEATNYIDPKTTPPSNQVLIDRLASGNHQQIKNIAEIIQRTRPDIILLNEFDYIRDPRQGIERFIKNYLNKGQSGASAIDYPYYYYAEVNTGKPSPFDLDGNGKKTGQGGDAWGFGLFHGQYGMVLLSRYPIVTEEIRTFQNFLWKDMPGALRPVDPETRQSWYSDAAWQQFPLSSKSHWDIPVEVNGERLHVLASHPTPPVFDGPEDRNGRRNHDEIRFWHDYITPGSGNYIYDDNGRRGGLKDKQRFVILGDQNASADEGGAMRSGIAALLDSPKVNNGKAPMSEGGKVHKPGNEFGRYHTAYWGMRADYVLPSTAGFDINQSGVFWPLKSHEHHRLIADRAASSDHRLVWVNLNLTALD